MITINKKQFSEDEIRKIVAESLSKQEVAGKLGFTYCNGKIIGKLKNLFESLSCLTDHFDSSAKLRANRKYPKIIKNCPICNKEFKSSLGSPKEKITCSNVCSNIYFSDVRHTDKSREKVSKSLILYNKSIESHMPDWLN
jgi:hypothetical protein